MGDLNFAQLTALDKLPPGIADLSNLQRLLLSDSGKACAVSDLTPLSALTDLELVYLHRTKVEEVNAVRPTLARNAVIARASSIVACSHNG